MPDDRQRSSEPAVEAERPFAERAEDRSVGACRLVTLHTPVEEVVSWRASFKGVPDFAAGDELVQSLVVALLDKGTRRRDRFEIAEVLEDRGAQVRFASDGLHIDASGRALREHSEEVLGIVAEQLREPLFDPDEFTKAQAQVAAKLRRSLESTGAQASGALARRLYPRAHPNYAPDPTEELARLERITLEEVQAYHAAHFGARELTFVLVGDLEGIDADRIIGASFGDWAAPPAAASFAREAQPEAPGRVLLPMPDKQNADVYMGHALPVYRQDDDYLPLYLANYILGGNFSARLMATIRDEMGLTYGIRSGFSGISTDYQGHWHVAVTLSQENVSRGVEATFTEVRRFVEEGVSSEELDEKKTTVTGSFKVGLATTGGIAASILRNVERGFGPEYLDQFPRLVEEVTLARTNEAIRRHFRPDDFHFAIAGSVEDVTGA